MRFEAGENEGGRRLDRILKKILKGASLSFIYRIIRKDVRINGKRATGEVLLKSGDVIEILLPDEQITELCGGRAGGRAGGAVGGADGGAEKARKQFGVVFEDENILVVNKPYGLLTHGDAAEKKNTLANQVLSWLSEKGAWTLSGTKTFIPAPANRLDRNTTGLVVFGKTLPAARDLAAMMRGCEDGNAFVEKVYVTVVKGRLAVPMTLKSRMEREEGRNITKTLQDAPGAAARGRAMVTEVRPLAEGIGYTLVEAKLLTGRTHQIRAQLAEAGFPVIGDRKYGEEETNRMASQKYGLRAQLLHAYRLTVLGGTGSLEYLEGKIFRAKPPARFSEIAEDLGCGMKMK